MQMKGQSRVELQSRDPWPEHVKGNGGFHEDRRKAGLEAGMPESGEEDGREKDEPSCKRATEETILWDSQVPIGARKKEQPDKLLRS